MSLGLVTVCFHFSVHPRPIAHIIDPIFTVPPYPTHHTLNSFCFSPSLYHTLNQTTPKILYSFLTTHVTFTALPAYHHSQHSQLFEHRQTVVWKNLKRPELSVKLASMSSSSTPATSTPQRFPVIQSPKVSLSPPHHLPKQEPQMRKTGQLLIDPCAPLTDVNFDIAADVCNDLSLGEDYRNVLLSPKNRSGSTCMPAFPKLPPSAAVAGEADLLTSGLNSNDSVSLPVLSPQPFRPHPIAPRHTFHPALLNMLFTPVFIDFLLPPDLRSLSHSMPQPILQQSANPVAGTSSTVTTSSFKSDANNAVVSQNQIYSDGQAPMAVPQTQEERIIERNRKGRERSLRTRRRNAFRLQTLERNVVYLTTENNLLKDVVSTLSWLAHNPVPSTSDSQIQSPHPLIIPFTALLLCALSRPLPYIPNSSRQCTSAIHVTHSGLYNSNLPPPSNTLLRAMTTPNVQQMRSQTETAVEAGELAHGNLTTKFDPGQPNELDGERAIPWAEEPVTPGTYKPQSELPIVASPDFALSSDDFHFPSLNIDEIDNLLKGPVSDSPRIDMPPSTPEGN